MTLSSQTNAVTEEDIKRMALGGDKTLLEMARTLLADKEVAYSVLNNWELTFVRDVARKSKEFADRMTDKQREVMKKILTKSNVTIGLMIAYNRAFETALPPFEEEYSAEFAAPAPKVDPLLDPEWGQF